MTKLMVSNILLTGMWLDAIFVDKKEIFITELVNHL